MSLTRRELVAALIEDQYGVDAAPTGENAILVEAPTMAFEGARMVERPGVDTTLGRRKQIFAGTLGSMSLTCEVKGSGAPGVAPEIGPLLRACGLAEDIVEGTSVTYRPASHGHESITLYYYEGSKVHKFVGCRGTVSFTLEVGGVMKAAFTLTGHVLAPSDASLPTPTYDTTVPPALIGVPFRVGSYGPVISSLNFDLANEVTTPPDISAPDGYSEVRITGRDPNGTFDPESVALAVNDFIDNWKTGASREIDTGVIGSQEGNRIQLILPKAYYRSVNPGAERDGIRVYENGFAAEQVTGDDEFSLIFT